MSRLLSSPVPVQRQVVIRTIASKSSPAAVAAATTTTARPASTPYISRRSSLAHFAFSPPTPPPMSCFKSLFGSKISMADAEAQVKQIIAEHPVVVFSKSYCPYCASTKSLLKSVGANPYIIELDRTDGGSSMQKALEQINGQRTVPNIYIGQKHIGGNSELQKLDKAGRLQPALKEAGVL